MGAKGKKGRQKGKQCELVIHFCLLVHWEGRFVIILIGEIFISIFCTLCNYFEDDNMLSINIYFVLFCYEILFYLFSVIKEMPKGLNSTLLGVTRGIWVPHMAFIISSLAPFPCCLPVPMDWAVLFHHIILSWYFCFGVSWQWNKSHETMNQMKPFLLYVVSLGYIVPAGQYITIGGN